MREIYWRTPCVCSCPCIGHRVSIPWTRKQKYLPARFRPTRPLRRRLTRADLVTFKRLRSHPHHGDKHMHADHPHLAPVPFSAKPFHRRGCMHITTSRFGCFFNILIISATNFPFFLFLYFSTKTIGYRVIGCIKRKKEKRVPHTHKNSKRKEAWMDMESSSVIINQSSAHMAFGVFLKRGFWDYDTTQHRHGMDGRMDR